MYNVADVVEGQYNQEYDLSSEESDEYSNLSTHAAYIFKDVEKFDFQAMLTRKKAQDAREAESKLKNISKTGLKMIGKSFTTVCLCFLHVLPALLQHLLLYFSLFYSIC